MPEGMVQTIATIWIIALAAVIAIVAFWRTMIKLLIIFAAAAIITTLAFGAIAFWQTLHYLVG